MKYHTRGEILQVGQERRRAARESFELERDLICSALYNQMVDLAGAVRAMRRVHRLAMLERTRRKAAVVELLEKLRGAK